MFKANKQSTEKEKNMYHVLYGNHSTWLQRCNPISPNCSLLATSVRLYQISSPDITTEHTEHTENAEKVPGCLGFNRGSPVIYCSPRVSARSAVSISHSVYARLGARYCAAPQAGQNFAPSLRGALQALQTGAAFC